MFGLLAGFNLGKGVKNLCSGWICRQVHCSTSLCESLGKSEWYRWDSSCLILGLFRSRSRQPEEGERNIQLIVSQEPKRVR